VATPIAWWLARSQHWLRSRSLLVGGTTLVCALPFWGSYLLVLWGPKGVVRATTEQRAFLGGPSAFHFEGFGVASVISSLPVYSATPAHAFNRQSKQSASGSGRLPTSFALDRFHHPSDTTGPPGIFDRPPYHFCPTTIGEFGVIPDDCAISAGNQSVISGIYDNVEAIRITPRPLARWRYGGVLVCGVVALYSLNGPRTLGDDEMSAWHSFGRAFTATIGDLR